MYDDTSVNLPTDNEKCEPSSLSASAPLSGCLHDTTTFNIITEPTDFDQQVEAPTYNS